MGLVYPIQRSTGSTDYFLFSRDEKKVLVGDIGLLLESNWGERPMRYHFGCNLAEFLFEQGDRFELKQKIRDRILTQLAEWLPFVGVDSITILLEGDDPTISSNTIAVMLRVRLLNRPTMDPVDMTFIVRK